VRSGRFTERHALRNDGLELPFGEHLSALLGRAPFGAQPFPLFNLRLLLAGIASKDVAHLRHARGVATLRFKRVRVAPGQEPIH
jgi:hypothetical protein